MELTTILQAAEEGHHVVNELPIPPIGFGIIAAIFFTVIFIATMQLAPRGTSPDVDSHADPSALPEDEARMLASYSAKKHH